MNPSDLTGRDLDLAVARALGYVWWSGRDCAFPGVSYLRPHETPPSGWQRVEDPSDDFGSPWLPGYDCDGRRIPEMFAEIRRLSGGAWVDLRCCDNFGAYTVNVDEPERDMVASGSTPNEALARLLLMVTQR